MDSPFHFKRFENSGEIFFVKTVVLCDVGCNIVLVSVKTSNFTLFLPILLLFFVLFSLDGSIDSLVFVLPELVVLLVICY